MTDTTQNPPREPIAADADYVKIIKSDVEVDKQFIEADGLPAKIIYYCKVCKSPVAPKRIGKRLSFKCTVCDREVSFGTETSVHNYYNTGSRPAQAIKQKQS